MAKIFGAVTGVEVARQGGEIVENPRLGVKTPNGIARTEQAFFASPTDIQAEYPKQTPFNEPVKLPSGQLIEKDVPATRLPSTRGHGWEYIQNELPGITRDDFDFVTTSSGGFILPSKDSSSSTLPATTDVWLPQLQELVGEGTEPWKPDTDGDGLTDGQEVHWVNRPFIKSEDSFARITVSKSYDLDPTDPDTDDDGAIDGGGFRRVGYEFSDVEAWEIGKQSNGEGEVWNMPSNPGEPDVIHVLPATDKSFREQHERFLRVENDKEYENYSGYVERIIDNTNKYLKETFSDAEPNPHIVTTTNDDGEWGRWDNPEPGIARTAENVLTDGRPTLADSTLVEMRQLREGLTWQIDNRDADVLSGFSGQPMGDVGGYSGGPGDKVSDFLSDQLIDARAGTSEGEYYDVRGDSAGDRPWKQGAFDNDYELPGGITIVGTNDPATTPDSADNIYFHELGHVLNAIHPEVTPDDNLNVKPGTEGVMCKDSCLVDISVEPFFAEEGSSILTAEYYSKGNKDRILGSGVDELDIGGDKSLATRNLSTVSTADESR